MKQPTFLNATVNDWTYGRIATGRMCEIYRVSIFEALPKINLEMAEKGYKSFKEIPKEIVMKILFSCSRRSPGVHVEPEKPVDRGRPEAARLQEGSQSLE